MNKKSGKWKVESGKYGGAARAYILPFRISSFPFSATRGFVSSRLGLTLIELLIAIAIIATLSALFLGASRSAMESARSARTKTTISKLHTLIMEHWASYETRRVDLLQAVQDDINELSEADANLQKYKAAVIQDCRLLALRELIKFEMPDRWSDFVNVNTSSLESSEWLTPVFLNTTPTISKIYFRRFMQAVQAAGGDEDKVADHQSAECLYLTIMLMTGDGEARTIFTAQDIADTDGDGAPEFIDGWGNPIGWSRWPAGFAVRSEIMTGDTSGDHDPFDPFRRNFTTATPTANNIGGNLAWLKPYVSQLRSTGPRGTALPDYRPGYRLVPLIYSAGPDGSWDMDSSGTSSVMDTEIRLDPYALRPDGTSNLSFPPNAPEYRFGMPWDSNEDGDDNSIDNIHNHLQDNR